MKTEPDVCLHRNLLCRFVVQCGGWCVCVSGQPGEAAPEGPGIPGLGTPPIPLRLRLGAAPGHDPLSHCVSCVWEARQPRGPIGAATKQLGPVLLGGRTHMAAARPASGLTREMGRAPTCRAVTGVGWNTVGFQKHEPPSAHVNSENPKTGRRHSPPLPEKTPGPRVRPAARVSLASPDCAPVSPPLKAVKAPLLTKKVPPIFKKKGNPPMPDLWGELQLVPRETLVGRPIWGEGREGWWLSRCWRSVPQDPPQLVRGTKASLV